MFVTLAHMRAFFNILTYMYKERKRVERLQNIFSQHKYLVSITTIISRKIK